MVRGLAGVMLISVVAAAGEVQARTGAAALPAPDFSKQPCISTCWACDPPWNDYMGWSEVTVIKDSLLDGWASCSHYYLGPCETFGNCDGRFAYEGPPLEQVWNASVNHETSAMRELIATYPDFIRVNWERSSVQVVNHGRKCPTFHG
jgi:hypothetical protein